MEFPTNLAIVEVHGHGVIGGNMCAGSVHLDVDVVRLERNIKLQGFAKNGRAHLLRSFFVCLRETGFSPNFVGKLPIDQIRRRNPVNDKSRDS